MWIFGIMRNIDFLLKADKQIKKKSLPILKWLTIELKDIEDHLDQITPPILHD